MKRVLFAILAITTAFFAQAQEEKETSPWDAKNFIGLEMRNIGPALMAGRIADIAIHPDDENTWYLAVGSGGVWKTENAGVTWSPIFDGEAVYSTGCITIDPSNPSILWLGTGENIGGRHVAYGDGIYRSTDGGGNWKNMGLKTSEHISKIIVHPRNSDVVWVAAQGPLWSSGGERGFYKTTDGGESWTRTLGNDEWTGVTDIAIDPRNPDLLYAATWDRHRTIAAYMGGGPGSGLHRSTDGGETWVELTEGLPKENMGKIGIAISPQNPDVIYAAIELHQREGGIYKSTDRGSTWAKQSDVVSGGTGPHYYQELYASPHQEGRIYLMDVRAQISEDGGKTFRTMNEANKHSDNHAMAFKMSDPDYLLFGTDGGLYESFDLGESWRFFANMPITQFYKVAVDDAEPFYNVYGGTQDNNTQGGPSRTDNVQGIQNGDWKVILFGDGHQPATEPGNPDIVYAQWQQGSLARIDMSTGEVTGIQPRAGEDEPHERFNWDAPILVSSHKPSRIYHGSYRLWKSDDRGDNWTAISGDLTRSQNRLQLDVMGRQQSYDNPWDLYAMSTFNTITSIAESPHDENVIYIGTDDGLLHRTDDLGENWTKMEVGNMPDVPATAYVNDIKVDLHDPNTVYVALDNHKHGNLSPYLFKSTNKGKSWKSLGNDLPEKTTVWRIVQDHKKENLLFIATEFGVYFSVNGGA
ncbi:MAG: glycosyl hydrolase, partial [Flavobacteriales bacterium]|nr:glycosyl hydrolase [Flavobacteriales bacterium]